MLISPRPHMNIFVPNMRTSEILPELERVLNSGWIGLGPEVAKFEEQICSYVHSQHATATSSCTSALQISLRALALQPGSKVATTPVTFVSTNHAILNEGHVPVFIDVNPLTGNITPLSLKEALSKHPDIRCLFMVHLAGYPCDIDEIEQICKESGVVIIEDCAHAFGASYKGRMIGDCENMCCWSFQAVKNLPVGDGGAVTTKNKTLDTLLKKLRWMGIDKDTISRAQSGYKWDYDVTEVGYKCFMNDITAAIGNVQIKYVSQDNARRKQIADYYRDNIRNAEKPEYTSDRQSSYHFYPLFFANKEKVYSELVDNGISPGVHYKLNTRYRMYSGSLVSGDMQGAQQYEKTQLTLPIHTKLSDNDVDLVVRIVNMS